MARYFCKVDATILWRVLLFWVVSRPWSIEAITGEARPVEKKKEHKISSGCVILNGYVEVTLTKDYSNSTLSQIEAKVRNVIYASMFPSFQKRLTLRNVNGL